MAPCELTTGVRVLGSFLAFSHPGKYVFPPRSILNDLCIKKSPGMGCLGTRGEDWVNKTSSSVASHSLQKRQGPDMGAHHASAAYEQFLIQLWSLSLAAGLWRKTGKDTRGLQQSSPVLPACRTILLTTNVYVLKVKKIKISDSSTFCCQNSGKPHPTAIKPQRDRERRNWGGSEGEADPPPVKSPPNPQIKPE